MTLAKKRKPMVPCEACKYKVEYEEHGEKKLECGQFEMKVLNSDGCTFGEFE